MARPLHKLTDATAKSDHLKAGCHGDGGGLYLSVSPSGSKSWVFYPAVSLAAARKRAGEHRITVAEGRDPIAEKGKQAEPTFAECVPLFLDSMEASWRNEKHRAQWRMTLTDYRRGIAAKKVSEIDTQDVLKVLNPIWQTKPETASRLRGQT